MFKGNTSSDDTWVKIASLVLAVMVWAAIKPTIKEGQGGDGDRPGVFNAFSTLADSTRTLEDLPITVLTRADDERGFAVYPSRITVTVRGAEDAVKALLPRDVEASVSLTDVVEATNLRKNVQVRVPGGLTVESRDPVAVEVKIVGEPQETPGAAGTHP